MTILGYHTVHELSDLWAAYMYELAQLQLAVPEAATAWIASDPTGYATFTNGLNALEAWVTGTAEPMVAPLLQQATATSSPSWDATGATASSSSIDNGATFDVVDWLVAGWATGPSGSGPGFDDLDRMMRANAAAAPFAPSYSKIPQPTAPDFDLAAYGLTDAATKVIEKAAKGTASVLVPIAATVGGLALLILLWRVTR